MTDRDDEPRVIRNDERSRYELHLEGKVVGFADFRTVGLRTSSPTEGTDGDVVVVFPHTVVDPAMRGRGLGAVLVGGALDDVRARGAKVEARCWYVAQFIDEHPEYGDLLAA